MGEIKKAYRIPRSEIS